MSELLAITIPIYKSETDHLEMISLKQCLKLLNTYPIIFFAPCDLDTKFYESVCEDADVDFKVERFDKKFFIGTGSYNKLMLSPAFYKRFINYKYILIYQLDAFIFKNDLVEWTQSDYDYVGAPIFLQQADTFDDSWCVGNGGFSLRKIEKHIRALQTFSYIKNIRELFEEILAQKTIKEKLKALCKLPLNLTVRNNSYYKFNTFPKNEDYFFGDYAPKTFDWFKVPTVREAAKFSIEGAIRTCYEFNGYEIPTGCHAWPKYDLPFWKPFIEKFGHLVERSKEFN